MMMKTLLLIFTGISYGLLSSAGVFTVLVAVGLVPRFAGKTHTAKHIILYEEMVIAGTVIGCIFSIFSRYLQIGAWWQSRYPRQIEIWVTTGVVLQLLFGLFSGMFIGCLALAIAEMLDSIPIFTRRISFRHGLGLVVLGIALGKVTGSLLYFWTELHRTVG